MREIKSEKYLGDVLFMGFKTYGRRNVGMYNKRNQFISFYVVDKRHTGLSVKYVRIDWIVNVLGKALQRYKHLFKDF